MDILDTKNTKIISSTLDILGTRVDNLSQREILKKVKLFFAEPRFHQIATINPEFILEAQKNRQFKNILNECNLNVADGFGIKLAFWRYGKNLKCRITGVDLMMEILKLASENNLEIFLVANEEGLSSWQETREAIQKFYPKFKKLRISGANLNKKTVNYKLENKNSSILFCNFGAPYQEFFIKSIKSDTIRLAMGVGGSFDFLTGKVRRAPKIMRILGGEWLWRIFQQKKNRWKRIKRIFQAVVIFPLKIILCPKK